jgi:ABC-type bacteriocin/lantibiotic exporter with double-glycine peptidase domain
VIRAALRRRTCILAEGPRFCGPAALATVARYYGLRVSQARIADMAGTDRQGTAILALKECAERLGFSASCGKVAAGQLDRLPLPAIVHWRVPEGHFVVLQGVGPRSVAVADPAIGFGRIPRAEFEDRWTGQAILLAPDEGFLPGRREPAPLAALARLAARRPRVAIGAAALAAGSVLASFALAALAQAALDRVLPARNERLLTMCAAGVIVALIVKEGTGLLRRRLLVEFGNEIELAVGLGYIESALRLPVLECERRRPGELASGLGDASKVRSALAGAVFAGLLDVALLLFYTAALCLWDPRAATAILCVVPAVLAVVACSCGRVARWQRVARLEMTEVMGGVVDAAAQIRTLKIFGAEAAVIRNLAVRYRAAVEALGTRVMASAACEAGCGLLTGAGAVLALVVGARQAMTGQLSAGSMIFFYSVAGMMFASAGRLGPAATMIQEASVGVERLGVANRDRHCEPADSRQLSAWSGDARLKGVEFRHQRGRAVLSGLDIEVAAGEHVAVIGATGTGKTTLAALLGGLYAPTAGEVRIGGHLLGAAPAPPRGTVGVVFQDAGLICASVRDNILLGLPGAPHAAVERCAELALAHEFITELPRGYDYVVGTSGAGLSSGQKQRIAIARALLCDPAVLVLDEATSGLDIVTERLVLDALFQARIGRTTILITHRLAAAARLKRIFLLAGGRVMESGPHAELVSAGGGYAELWRAAAAAAPANAAVAGHV